MASLRKEVRKLEEEELFERTLLPDAPRIGEQPAPTGDVDSIMASLMGPASGSAHPPEVPAGVAGFASALRSHGIFGEDDATPVEHEPSAADKGKARVT
jgi:hypothetical protein